MRDVLFTGPDDMWDRRVLSGLVISEAHEWAGLVKSLHGLVH